MNKVFCDFCQQQMNNYENAITMASIKKLIDISSGGELLKEVPVQEDVCGTCAKVVRKALDGIKKK